MIVVVEGMQQKTAQTKRAARNKKYANFREAERRRDGKTDDRRSNKEREGRRRPSKKKASDSDLEFDEQGFLPGTSKVGSYDNDFISDMQNRRVQVFGDPGIYKIRE